MEKTNQRKRPYYSELLRRQVVSEYTSGYYSKTDLMLKYGILGSTTIDGWIENYGNFADEITGEKKKKHREQIMEKKEKKSRELGVDVGQSKVKGKRYRSDEQERISELEAQLAKEKLRQQLYSRIIELASEE